MELLANRNGFNEVVYPYSRFCNKVQYETNMRLIVFAILAFNCASAALAQTEDDFDPMTVDVVDAINCRIDAPTYNGFALTLNGSDKYWKKRGWREIKSSNPFMSEYRLRAPIQIAGIQTYRVAFTSSGVLAILDLADPSDLAKREEIVNQADPATLIESLGLTPEQAAQIPTTKKFLGERVFADVTEKDEALGISFHTRITRNISTVTSHPGKTLYGCSYRIEMSDY